MAWKKFKQDEKHTLLAGYDSRWIVSDTRRCQDQRSSWKNKQKFKKNELTVDTKSSSRRSASGARAQLVMALGEYQTFRTSTAHYSFWMQRFFNTLTIRGGQKVSQRLMSTALWGLSKLFNEDPILLVFELFELYRYPFLAVQVQRGWSSFIRLTFLPWWRQYLVLMRWFTRSLYSTKVNKSIGILAFRELLALLVDPTTSNTVRRRAIVVTLSTQSRLALNFRWK